MLLQDCARTSNDVIQYLSGYVSLEKASAPWNKQKTYIMFLYRVYVEPISLQKRWNAVMMGLCTAGDASSVPLKPFSGDEFH